MQECRIQRLRITLEERHRENFTECSRLLGLGDDGWAAAPGFRNLVELVAIVSTMDRERKAGSTLSDRGLFYFAAELCGLEADSERPS